MDRKPLTGPLTFPDGGITMKAAGVRQTAERNNALGIQREKYVSRSQNSTSYYIDDVEDEFASETDLRGYLQEQY